MSTLSQQRLFPQKVFISVDEAAKAGFFATTAQQPAEGEPSANNANKKILKTFDVRFSLDDPLNYGRNCYRRAHIPNAMFIDLDTELSGAITAATGRHPLPACRDFIATMVKSLGGEGSGASPPSYSNTAVLCYDDQCGALAASRLWWMLQNVGVEAYVLDGGVQAYKAAAEAEEKEEGHHTSKAAGKGGKQSFPSLIRSGGSDGDVSHFRGILTKDLPNPSPAAIKAWPFQWQWSHIVDGQRVSQLYFKTADATNHSILPLPPLFIDARFALRFNSTKRSFGGDKLAGHVPHSVSRPWNANIAVPASASGTGRRKLPKLKPTGELSKEFTAILENYNARQKNHCLQLGGASLSSASRPAASFDNAIFSCASGVSACFNIAITTHLGLGTPFLYSGAWSECEVINKKYLVAASHKQNGFRMDVVKKVNPSTATPIENNDPKRPFPIQQQLKVLAVRGDADVDTVTSCSSPGNCSGGNGNGNVCAIASAKLLNLITSNGSASPLFVGEVADVFVVNPQSGEGDEVLLGRVEGVGRPTACAGGSKL